MISNSFIAVERCALKPQKIPVSQITNKALGSWKHKCIRQWLYVRQLCKFEMMSLIVICVSVQHNVNSVTTHLRHQGSHWARAQMKFWCFCGEASQKPFISSFELHTYNFAWQLQNAFRTFKERDNNLSSLQ